MKESCTSYSASELSLITMKILVVDDNQSITKMLAKMLNLQGCEVVISNNARDGLSLIESNNYDAVILDIAMPEFSGIDVINALNESGKIKENKIIVMTAYAQSDKYLEELKEKGAHFILKKPVEINALLSTLKSVCDK